MTPIVLSVLAIVLGTILGLMRWGAILAAGPVRSFALVATVAVVLVQLLPTAVSELGLPGLGVFLIAAFLPALLERAVGGLGGGDDDARHSHESHDHAPGELGEHAHHRAHGSDREIGLELGYLALLAHQAGDGLSLAATAGERGHAHAAVTLSILAHTVPLVALVVLAFANHYGRQTALVRATGLAVAMVAGSAAVGLVPADVVTPAEPWILAVVGGLLLHVITHDWQPARPRTSTTRLAELVAVLAGLLLTLLGTALPGQDPGVGGAPTPDPAWQILTLLVGLLGASTPMLLLGLLVAAAIQTWSGERPPPRLAQGRGAGLALRGALLGVQLPVCACGVLPVARVLRGSGAGPALVVAFTLATPALGAETLALTWHLLGTPFAALRLVTALFVSIGAALALARVARPDATDPALPPVAAALALATHPHAAHGTPSGSIIHDPRPRATARVLENFDELFHHVGPWTLLGVAIAALVALAVPPGALAIIARTPFELIVVSLVAIPSYVCAAAVTPLALVLASKGMSPGALLVGLLLGPATNTATILALHRWYGPRATLVGLATLVLATWLVGSSVNGLTHDIMPSVGSLEIAAPGAGALAAVALLAVLVLRAIWQHGLVGWFGSIGESFAAHGPAAPAHDA